MSKARCFNCYVGLPAGKPLEELIESRLPIFCCTECSLKFPDNGTEEFEERLKYMDKFVEAD